MDAIRDLNCQYVEEHDLVSAYLTGGLSEEEAEAFEKHYFGCEKCWAEVKAGEEIRAALKGERGSAARAPVATDNVRRGPWTTWKVLALAAAVGIVAAGTVLMLNRPAGIDALARATGTRRVTTARLTGPFEYGTVESVPRAADSKPTVSKRLKSVAAQLHEKEEADPSAENHHAAGLAHLVVDEWDEAVDSLQKAEKLAPKDARIEADLAAAYYARATRKNQDKDLPAAYETARKSVDLDPNLAPAQYNLALILDALGHKEEALEAWKTYLRLDRSSGWAKEADARKKALEAPPRSELWRRERSELDAAAEAADAQRLDKLVRLFPQQSRQYIEDDVLAQWASSSSSDTADRNLRIAREIARALSRAKGESLSVDAIAAIESERRAGNAERWESLRLGHRLYGEARALYRGGNIDGAFDRFRRAEESLRKTASPFLYFALGGEASCDLYGSKASEAQPLVAQLETEARKSGGRYRALLGHALWLRGMIEAAAGRPYESLTSYREALGVFEQLDERENIAGLHGLLAGAYVELGEPETAWTHRIAALRLLDSGSSLSRLDNALGDVARTSLDEGYPRLALLADDAEIRVAEGRGTQVVKTYSRLWRAEVADRLNHGDVASEELARAGQECDRITDKPTRERARAEIELASVRTASKNAPDRALASADRVIAFMRDVDQRGYVAEVLLIRGRLHRARGNLEQARQDFLDGIRQLEESRQDIAQEDLRISYFETARGLFDEAIGLAVEKGDVAEAFQLADRAHGRALLDSVSKDLRPRPAISLLDLQRGLAPREALVEFWTSGSRSYAWVVRRDRIAVGSLPGSQAIHEHVDKTVRALSEAADFSATNLLLAECYEQVFRPIEPHLDGISSLSIVPDGQLHALPFAALRDKERSRYLVERFEIEVVPSAAILVLPSRTPRTDALQALIIANPAFDQTRFARLSRLAGSEAESEKVSSWVRSSRIIKGMDATKSVFLQLIPHYGVVHFAGHAIVNRTQPGFSGLLLAPDPSAGNDAGVVYAHEIERLDLSHTSLVFISACDTAAGPIRTSEGMLGLARAFLAAGAPEVVATLWQVDDNAAARLVSLFYASLAAGRSSSAALRDAQLDCIRSTREPGRLTLWWASFDLLRA